MLPDIVTGLSSTRSPHSCPWRDSDSSTVLVSSSWQVSWQSPCPPRDRTRGAQSSWQTCTIFQIKFSHKKVPQHSCNLPRGYTYLQLQTRSLYEKQYSRVYWVAVIRIEHKQRFERSIGWFPWGFYYGIQLYFWVYSGDFQLGPGTKLNGWKRQTI